MNLIIHHLTAWKAAHAKYQFSPVETPNNWPVLVSFTPAAEEGTTTPVLVVTVDMAAKMLASCTAARLAQLDGITLASLIVNLPKQLTPAKIGTIPSGPSDKPLTQTVEVINAEDGSTATLSGLPGGVAFKPGDMINFNGQQYVVSESSQVEAMLITGSENSAQIPGLEEIPMDPSKLDESQKIADLGDVNEHVLDVERAI